MSSILSATTDSTDKRSVSRGREFQSSGRGGAGNIRRSESQDPSTIAPEELPRGREPAPAFSPTAKIVSVGRGGAGNFRSPSRDPAKVGENHPQTASIISEHAANTAEYERELIRASVEAKQNGVFSSGRGGAGNINKSRSRSRGPAASISPHPFHSTGRGGAGNIKPGDGVEIDLTEDHERQAHHHDEGIHSTGRGGLANMTVLANPLPEEIPPHPAHEVVSSGRGGAGNIRSRSASRDPSQARSPSREPNGRSFSRERVREVWNKVTHGPGHHHHHPSAVSGAIPPVTEAAQVE
ncbi:hypothetical protein JAAARDRAFT_143114 [Jaapia argillacea MUCL 33604]|uniref:Uncharacterized protein n=1 Tax=Jaapia argillacea MUCL 33604 TaxID=933084 RepID=A0A067PGQ5_9AGAM|nr:hypothetical protein JAAARDRAFT_143114 [Jaapia argillacea MUCL 33604]